MTYRWECLTENAAYAARDGAGLLSYKDRLWMLGGWNPDDKVHFPRVCNSEVWTTRDGKVWTMVNQQPPWEGRHTAGYAVHNGAMFIVGGDPIQKHYQYDVWKSTDGLQWDLVCDHVPWGPRVLHYTVSFAGKLWIMGGQTLPPFAPEEELFYNDVWCSDDGEHWTQLIEDAPWSHRGMIGGAAVLHDRIWLLGGGVYDTPKRPQRQYFNEVWSTADGKNWKQHANAPWAARQYHDVAVWDGKLWVLEGYHKESGNRKDVWYSSDGETWTEVPGTPWLPRHAAGVCAHGDALWVVGGNNMTPDAWRLVRA